MSAILERPPFRCYACRGDQFMLTFGGRSQPVVTCQGCGQSYGIASGGALPVRLVGDDGGLADEPLRYTDADRAYDLHAMEADHGIRA